MDEKSAAKLEMSSLREIRRAILAHLVRQSGGPSPDPRDAVRLAQHRYSLVPREARVGRFTARISLISSEEWALDFNPATPKLQLVAAIWHELAELLCLSDDLVNFANFATSSYTESARSAYDQRHLCAVGVERYVCRQLRRHPVIAEEVRVDGVRRALIARAATAPGEPILPQIEREPWYDDECGPSPFSPA